MHSRSIRFLVGFQPFAIAARVSDREGHRSKDFYCSSGTCCFSVDFVKEGSVAVMSEKEDNRIFVGGLSRDTTERRLEAEFSRFGKVIEAQV